MLGIDGREKDKTNELSLLATYSIVYCSFTSSTSRPMRIFARAGTVFTVTRRYVGGMLRYIYICLFFKSRLEI